MDRRQFVRSAGAAALLTGVGGLAAACGKPESKTGTTTTGKRGTRPVTLGFIALTDCAPLIAAKEQGIFDKYDLDVRLEKQASWPATRDNLLTGKIDGGHVLFSMPLSVAAKIGGKGSTDLKIALVLNQNGQAITLNKKFSAAGYADLEKAKAALESHGTTMAMTFPGGTHDMWLRYWLRALKVNEKKISIKPVPPPNMVQNMQAGNMDGDCVGEPWNAAAVRKKIGFTAIATQDLWAGHPEKALVVNGALAEKKDVLADLMKAVLEAQQWLDNLDNRAEFAEVLAADKYVKSAAVDFKGRFAKGVYDLGEGLGEKKFDATTNMRFFGDGEVPFPRKSHALWFLAQYERLGLVKAPIPDKEKLVDTVILSDLYKQVASEMKVDVPDDMVPFEVKLDGATFDPKDLAKEIART